MQKMMHLGLDLDNTIICYDDVFVKVAKDLNIIPQHYIGNKQSLKKYIWDSFLDGDYVWQQLQGQIYGRYIHQATVFDGFMSFLKRCLHQSNIKISIVSHKTMYGHMDKDRVNLRDAALDWLSKNQVIGHESFSLQNVFFESTREEKVKRIQELNCTHFVDDLMEVFTENMFPKTIKKYLFAPHGISHEFNSPMMDIQTYSTWTEIENAFFQ